MNHFMCGRHVEHMRQRSDCRLIFYYVMLVVFRLRHSTLVHCTAVAPERSPNGAMGQTPTW